MKKVIVADSTLHQNKAFGFKESIEIARQLEKLNVDIIEMPKITDEAKDVLLIKTVASFIKTGAISVDGGTTAEEIKTAASALSSAVSPRIRISLPVSDVGMEYSFRKKGPAMIKFAGELISLAAKECDDVEFCALDATRADSNTLKDILSAAVDAGAKTVTLYDNEGILFPDEMAQFVKDTVIAADIAGRAQIGICCTDITGMAAASAFTVLRESADLIKTAVSGGITELKTATEIMRTCEYHTNIKTNIDFTSSRRIISRIELIIGADDDEGQ